MTVWHYANTWSNQIAPVQVEKFTDSSVWIRERRHARRTTAEIYAPTWDEAHSYLMAHWERQVADARRQLEYVNGKMGNVKGLRRPEMGKEAQP